MDTESPGDINLAGVSMGKSQEEKRRRAGGREKGEEMKREAGGEEKQEEGRRRGAQGSSCLQHSPNSQLVKGHLWDSDHKPGWFGQAQPRPTRAGSYMS